MKLKSKFLTTLMICLVSMIFWSGAVLYADETEYDFSKARTITEGKQTVEVSNDDGETIFAFTPKVAGKYKFDFAQQNVNYGIYVGIMTENEDVLNSKKTSEESLSIECTFRAGIKYYVIYNNTRQPEANYSLDINVNKVDSNKIIIKEKNEGSSIDVTKSNIKGLSWDADTSTLTMDDYVCEDERILWIDMRECTDGDILFIDVKGINIIRNKFAIDVLGTSGSVVFIGTGELNIGDVSTKKGELAICSSNKIVIDGPSINIVGCFWQEVISAGDILMLSGSINVDMYPCEEDGLKCHYGDIYADFSFIMKGGTILIKYEDPVEGCTAVSGFGDPIDAGSFLEFLSGTVIITGNAEIIELEGQIPSNALIGEKAVILSGEKIDISKLKIDVLEKTFEYDGTEKKAKVKIEGLKEGIDYSVEYKNNVNVGKAEIIVTGIGCFTGRLEANFDIVDPKKSDVKTLVADGPKAGSVVKDKKYIYVVTKAGSKDGSLIGEVKVIGLKKKSLKEIKIAANVKIKGVTYKVTSVGANAFKGNKKITKATIGKNVVNIGNNAFANCKKLKQVTINSKKLKKIGKGAFAKDKKLNKIIIKSNKLSKVGKNFVKGTSKKLVIKVPKKKKTKYAKKFVNAGFKGKVK